MSRAAIPVVLSIAALGTGLLTPSAASWTRSSPKPGVSPRSDVQVLFVGAHPDDESSMLSTLGQWRQRYGVRTGVATITRGEGGGNAVGPEEGPRLGRIREAEERRAVGKVGISDVYNLDEPDLYYTVSAPLTERAWNHRRVLRKLVRVVRETRPEVVVTMDPAPLPGNHGNHQYAARLALEAYRKAADPEAFPEQLHSEGSRPWSVRRVLSDADSPRPDTRGPACERDVAPPAAPGRWYGIWEGRRASTGETWAQRQRVAEREYASQGWANRPDLPDDPANLGCDYLTELATRAPHAPGARGPGAALSGAVLPVPGAVPVGTGLAVSPGRSRVVPGDSVAVRATVTAPRDRALPAGRVSLHVPRGWRVHGDGAHPGLPPGASADLSFTVTVPDGWQPGRVPLSVRLDTALGTGVVHQRLDVVPPVVAEQAALPGVAEFRQWADTAGFPLLADAVPPVRTIPSGGSRDVEVRVHNYSRQTRSGAVRMDPPAGFAVDEPRRGFRDLAPGATTSVRYRVRNTDPTMPTGMRGGDHHYTLTTDTGVRGRSAAALELVPTTTIPRVSSPATVDGRGAPGEYPGDELDLSARWEGDPCASSADCSATARLSWHDDHLNALVEVSDDRSGSRLDPTDCKRHWRTDAVELTIDPRGESENTSSTFKLGVLPSTDDPAAGNPPCFARDADNRQGPGEVTAPGVRVASTPRSDGYTLEMAIPFRVLPGTVDPRRMGLNLLVYDSDTRDKTGQTRIGWSAWEGVQGDPYRWGTAVLRGRQPEQPVDPPPPRLPSEPLSSVDSPGSIAQAARLGTALGALPPAGDSGAQVTAAERVDTGVRVRLSANGPGRAHLFVVDRAGTVVGDMVVRVDGPGDRWSTVPVNGPSRRVLSGFRTPDNATGASALPIR